MWATPTWSARRASLPPARSPPAQRLAAETWAGAAGRRRLTFLPLAHAIRSGRRARGLLGRTTGTLPLCGRYSSSLSTGASRGPLR
eukprot:3385123-Alexandrium_andersonii.AAC.1